MTVTALDTYGNTAGGYVGTVHFDSTDTAVGAVAPADYTFVTGDHGVHTFSAGVTLVTSGLQTVTVSHVSTHGGGQRGADHVPPTLSLPKDVSGFRGQVVTVPINVNGLLDSDPFHPAQGLSSAYFVVQYDPSVFTVSDSGRSVWVR